MVPNLPAALRAARRRALGRRSAAQGTESGRRSAGRPDAELTARPTAESCLDDRQLHPRVAERPMERTVGEEDEVRPARFGIVEQTQKSTPVRATAPRRRWRSSSRRRPQRPRNPAATFPAATAAPSPLLAGGASQPTAWAATASATKVLPMPTSSASTAPQAASAGVRESPARSPSADRHRRRRCALGCVDRCARGRV